MNLGETRLFAENHFGAICSIESFCKKGNARLEGVYFSRGVCFTLPQRISGPWQSGRHEPSGHGIQTFLQKGWETPTCHIYGSNLVLLSFWGPYLVLQYLVLTFTDIYPLWAQAPVSSDPAIFQGSPAALHSLTTRKGCPSAWDLIFGYFCYVDAKNKCH